jgi:hypothetical protein
MNAFVRIVAVAGLALAPSATLAQSALSQDQLTKLIGSGGTLKLGGPDEGYSGTLVLKSNGTGEGKATTDSGDRIQFSGTWAIRDGKFCRTWSGIGTGEESCETWVPTSPRSVDVIVNGEKIGANSW